MDGKQSLCSLNTASSLLPSDSSPVGCQVVSTPSSHAHVPKSLLISQPKQQLPFPNPQPPPFPLTPFVSRLLLCSLRKATQFTMASAAPTSGDGGTFLVAAYMSHTTHPRCRVRGSERARGIRTPQPRGPQAQREGENLPPSACGVTWGSEPCVLCGKTRV